METCLIDAQNPEKRRDQMNNYGNVLSLTPAVAPSWQSRGRGSATVRWPFVSRIIQETHGRICMEIGPQVETGPVGPRWNPALHPDVGDVFFSLLIAVTHL